MARKQGFESYTELAYAKMLRTEYNKDAVASFRQQVVEVAVPIASAIRKEQAQRIGVDSLYFHDVPYFFPDGNPTPKGDPDWIVEQGATMYRDLSNETDVFYQGMCDKDMMDLVNRKQQSGRRFLWVHTRSQITLYILEF